jgi:hypothetical protein
MATNSINLPPGFQLDEQKMAKSNLPPGFQLDSDVRPERSSLALDMFSKAVGLTPAGMAAKGAMSFLKGQDALTRGAERLGEYATEELGKRQVPHWLSAGVGTAISIAPDIAVGLAGGAGSKAMRMFKKVPDVAIPLARRAIGMTSPMLKTPFARREANLAARTALEEGVIPHAGSPSVMFKRASDIASKAGEKIGQTLKKVDFFKVAPEAEYDLEQARRFITKGTSEGVFASGNKVVDTVKKTISQLYGNPEAPDANIYNAAKNALANSLDFFADKASQSANKAVVNNMASTIRKVVNKYLPGSYDEFLKNQRLFHRAEVMKQGLNPELARQMGSRLVSPYATLAGIGQLAAGSPGRAAATVGVVEPLMRRGAGAGARALTSAYRSLPTAAAATALGVRTGMRPPPDEKIARKYMNRAKAKGLKGAAAAAEARRMYEEEEGQ